jgi:diketogulonate reductase-like aldo/keto reductase
MLARKFKLNDNQFIPSLGFGTWQLQGEECRQAVETALKTGYRLIDTAAAYGNHEEVGTAIKNSGLNRSEIFLTSKIWRTDLGGNDVTAACEKALSELKTSYLDLYLIHWPNKTIPIQVTMESLKELKSEGLIRAIGVSNFNQAHMDDVLKTGSEITANQVEFHPSLYQKALLEYCRKNNILMMAYSPIAQGEDLKPEPVQRLAAKYSRSASQVVLNWIISKGVTPLPRSANQEHIQDNFGCLDFEMTAEDHALIDTCDRNNRQVNPEFSEF